MFSKKHLSYWLFASLLTETLCATYCLKLPQYSALFSMLYFIAGMGIVLLMPALPPASLVNDNLPPARSVRYMKILSLLALALAIFFTSARILRSVDIDVHNADMLPVIKVMNQRMLQGHFREVYDRIPGIWNGTRPIYLPAMWLPFAPAVLFDADMRWVPVIALFFVFTFFVIRLRPGKKSPAFFVLLTAGILLWCWIFLEDDMHGLVGMTEEGIVILYYTLLLLAILSDQVLLIAIAASLCLLSRYAMIGWVPAFAAYLFLRNRKQESFIFAAVIMAVILLLLLLPFGWNNFVQLLELPAKYIPFTERVWKDSPEVFTDGLGFARFFVPEHTALLHRLLITGSLLTPLLFVLISIYIGREKRLSNIPLATLKLSVLVFYNFIDVPYTYLFYTSSFISLIAVAALANAPSHDEINATGVPVAGS